MKAISFTVFVCLLCVSVFAGKDLKDIPFGELPEDLQFVVTQFEKSVLEHDTALVFGLLDNDYKDHQWNKYLKKRTDFFLNEFFCGLVTGTDQTHCLVFGDILMVER